MVTNARRPRFDEIMVPNRRKTVKECQKMLKTFQTVRKYPKCLGRQKRSIFFPGATAAAASLLCARRVSTATGPNRQDAANAVPDDGSAAGGPARPRRDAARGRHAASRLLLGALPLARAGGGHLSGAERGHPKEPAPQRHGRRCRPKPPPPLRLAEADAVGARPHGKSSPRAQLPSPI